MTADERPMTGFLATLTDEQRAAALAYRGPENLGADDERDAASIVAKLAEAVVPKALEPDTVALRVGMEGDELRVEEVSYRDFHNAEMDAASPGYSERRTVLKAKQDV